MTTEPLASTSISRTKSLRIDTGGAVKRFYLMLLRKRGASSQKMAIKTFSPMRYTTLLAAVCMLIAGNAHATPRSRMFEVARGVQIHFLEDGNIGGSKVKSE